mgnify:CR=1 FL=1
MSILSIVWLCHPHFCSHLTFWLWQVGCSFFQIIFNKNTFNSDFSNVDFLRYLNKHQKCLIWILTPKNTFNIWIFAPKLAKVALLTQFLKKNLLASLAKLKNKTSFSDFQTLLFSEKLTTLPILVIMDKADAAMLTSWLSNIVCWHEDDC